MVATKRLKWLSKTVMKLGYQLKMVEVPVDGPAVLYNGNTPVVLSTTIPESIHKKKTLTLGYHHMRKQVTARIDVYRHTRPERSIAELLMKLLGGQAVHTLVKRDILVRTPHRG